MTGVDKTFDAAAKKLSTLEVGERKLSLECLETVQTICAFEEEWLELEAACKEDFTYFQNYNWCIEYYKQFADDITNKHCPIPQVFVLKQDDKPIMIWPLMRIQSRTGLKILTTATEPLGQYSNLLFDRAKFDASLGKLVLDFIIKHSKSDSLSFNNYPENSIVDKIIGTKGIKENSNLESSILDLKRYENWDSYFQTLSKAQRKSRRRDKNKLMAQGDITYDVIKPSADGFEHLVERALDMKKQWLLETGRTSGLLDEKCTREMFKSLKSSSTSGPVVHALKLNGNPIAIELGMIKADRYYSYLGAIDWHYKDLSPGKVQIEMSQEWSMSRGMKYFDLLHDPSDYKTSWSNLKHKVISRNIPVTYKGFIYSQLWKTHIRPKIKKIYHFAGTKNRERLNKAVSIFQKKS